MTAFIKYAAIRLLLFLVPFGIMLLVGWNPLIAGGLSLILASLASYIFLRKQRDDLAAALAERAERRKAEREAGTMDENAEDALLDAQESDPVPDAPESATETHEAESTVADDRDNQRDR